MGVWIDNKPSDYLDSVHVLYDYNDGPNDDLSLLKRMFQCDECEVKISATSSDIDAKLTYYANSYIQFNYNVNSVSNMRIKLTYSYDKVKKIKWKQWNKDTVIFEANKNEKTVTWDAEFLWLTVDAKPLTKSDMFEIIIDGSILMNNSSFGYFPYVVEINIETNYEPYQVLSGNYYFDTNIQSTKWLSENLKETNTNRQVVYKHNMYDYKNHNYGYGIIPGYKINKKNLHGWIDKTMKSNNIEEYFLNGNLNYGNFSSTYNDLESQPLKFNTIFINNKPVFPIICFESYNTIITSGQKNIPKLEMTWDASQSKLTVNNKQYIVEANDKIILCYRYPSIISNPFASSSIQNKRNAVTWNYPNYGYDINLQTTVNFQNIDDYEYYDNTSLYDLTDKLQQVSTIPDFVVTNKWTNSQSFPTVHNKIESFMDQYVFTNNLIYCQLTNSAGTITKTDTISDYFYNANHQKTTTKTNFKTTVTWNDFGTNIFIYYNTVKYPYEMIESQYPRMQTISQNNIVHKYTVKATSSTVDKYLGTASITFGWAIGGILTNIQGCPFLCEYYTKPTDSDTHMKENGSGYGIKHTIEQTSKISFNLSAPTANRCSSAIVLIKNGKLLENS